MRRGEIFSTPCIWAKSEFLEAPYKQPNHGLTPSNGVGAEEKLTHCICSSLTSYFACGVDRVAYLRQIFDAH